MRTNLFWEAPSGGNHGHLLPSFSIPEVRKPAHRSTDQHIRHKSQDRRDDQGLARINPAQYYDLVNYVHEDCHDENPDDVPETLPQDLAPVPPMKKQAIAVGRAAGARIFHACPEPNNDGNQRLQHKPESEWSMNPANQVFQDTLEHVRQDFLGLCHSNEVAVAQNKVCIRARVLLVPQVVKDTTNFSPLAGGLLLAKSCHDPLSAYFLAKHSPSANFELHRRSCYLPTWQLGNIAHRAGVIAEV